MREAGLNDVGFVAQASHGFAKLMAQLGQVMATHVVEFNLFEIAPDAFIRVQVGGITRQTFQMEASGPPVGRNSRTAGP